ncbi:MAG: EVE domain-containing protein [Bacillota bacterium]
MSKSNDKHYFLITTPKDFEIDLRNKFSLAGFPERYKKSVKNFKSGDKIVYYIKGKYSFGAITEVVGDYHYDRTQIWNDWFNLFPVRIKTKPLYFFNKFENMISVKEIWDDLNFLKVKKKWGAYFQGSFRNLNKKDYKVIEKAFIERVNKLKN